MDTKQAIINSAIAIFNEDFSAPLDEIVNATGISRRTLHRYFKDRVDLLVACRNDMMKTWQAAMIAAYQSSSDPIKQLELMLYAGIDCGVKYAFLNKLQERMPNHKIPEIEKNVAYETIRNKWFSLVPKLQKKRVISDQVTAYWIRALFSSMITTTIDTLKSGNIAPNDVKKFAWYSFRRSIGIE